MFVLLITLLTIIFALSAVLAVTLIVIDQARRETTTRYTIRTDQAAGTTQRSPYSES